MGTSLLGRSPRGHSIPPIRKVIRHVSLGIYSFKREPEKTKSTKGRSNQAERSRARKLKRRQEIQADLDAKRRNAPAKSVVTPQKDIQKPPEIPKPTVIETTGPKMKSQTKKRPKTHFRKTKKPGRA